jgi:predicted PurR-regulated permease PerM
VDFLTLPFLFFSNVFSVLIVFVFAFYMLLGYKDIKNKIADLLGEDKGKKISRILEAVEQNLASGRLRINSNACCSHRKLLGVFAS